MRRKPLPEPDEYGMIEMKKPTSESELRGQRWMLATVAGAALLLGGGLALRFTVLKDAYSASRFPKTIITPATPAPTLSEAMRERESRKVGGRIGPGYASAGSAGASRQAPVPSGASALPRDTGVNASTFAGKGSATYVSGAPPAGSTGYAGSSYSNTPPASNSPYGSTKSPGPGAAPGGYSSPYGGSSSPYGGSASGSAGSPYSSGPSGSGNTYGSSTGNGGYGSTSGSTTGYGGSTSSGYGGGSGGSGGSSYGTGTSGFGASGAGPL